MDFVSSAKGTDLQNTWVNKHKYLLHLNEEHICTANTFLLITILSAPENQDMRRTIRNTYGTLKRVQGLSVRFIFLLGATTNESSSYINPRITQESEAYHDIIKGDFIDHYKNLTHKTVMGLYWFNRYCRKAKYILKIDDDTVLNVYKVVSFLRDLQMNNNNREVSNLFYCNVVSFARPNRKEDSKFYLNYTEYPYKYQPDYCAGPGYLFSNDVGVALYKASAKVPYLFIEDVFMGFCAKLSGIPLTHHVFGFYMDTSREWFNYTSDWVVLLHARRDIQLWNQLWNIYFSSPAQHSMKYYQTIKVLFAVVVLYAIFICIYLIQKVNTLVLGTLSAAESISRSILTKQGKQKKSLPFL